MSSERSALSASDKQWIEALELDLAALTEVTGADATALSTARNNIQLQRAQAVAAATRTVVVDERPVTVDTIVSEIMARLAAQNAPPMAATPAPIAGASQDAPADTGSQDAPADLGGLVFAPPAAPV